MSADKLLAALRRRRIAYRPIAPLLFSSSCPVCGHTLYVSGLDDPATLTCLGGCDDELVRDWLLGGRELEGWSA